MEFSRIRTSQGSEGWRWSILRECDGAVFGVRFYSAKEHYKSEAGAIRAGRRWARKHGTLRED